MFSLFIAKVVVNQVNKRLLKMNGFHVIEMYLNYR